MGIEQKLEEIVNLIIDLSEQAAANARALVADTRNLRAQMQSDLVGAERKKLEDKITQEKKELAEYTILVNELPPGKLYCWIIREEGQGRQCEVRALAATEGPEETSSIEYAQLRQVAPKLATALPKPSSYRLITADTPISLEALASAEIVDGLKLKRVSEAFSELRDGPLVGMIMEQEQNLAASENDQAIWLKIVEMTATYAEGAKSTADELKNLNLQRDFFKKNLHTARKAVQVRKGCCIFMGPKMFYSLWIGDSPVLLYEKGRVSYLCTTRKDDPLEMRTADAELVVMKKRIQLAELLLGLGDNMFLDRHGYVLEGKQQKYAADIFHQVLTGVDILPRPETPTGYVKEETSSGEKKQKPAPIVYRVWSQIYLAESRPDSVTKGRLLGSGGSYKAFHFRGRTVVEFDQGERATYLFSTKYFNGLRQWNRSELLSTKPEGFDGRILHDDPKQWKDSVEKFLS